MQDTNAGSGTQNISYGRDQNVNNGQGNFFVNNIGRYFWSLITINPGHDSLGSAALWKKIEGVGASHNAEQQFERGACLLGTREEVIATIHEWITSSESGNPPICWVLGTAGIGKTAIAIDVAKACAENQSLVTSFLFFRTDEKRNNPSSLFLSIAHGLATSIPYLRHVIHGKIASDPQILESRLEEQFRDLVLNPSLKLLPDPSASWLTRLLAMVSPQRCPPSRHPNLVIIDGLDECSDDKTQLRILSIIFSAFQTSPYPPLRFLICSRPEAWIREALDSEQLRPLAKHIRLDEEFHAGKDIEQYLLHEFQAIVADPKYRNIQFPYPWPSRDIVACLVQNSCGQFIYVVTVMKWIRANALHPDEQLRIILKQSPKRGLSSPYRELDNLYHIILSTHPEPEALKHVLAAILFLPLIRILSLFGEGGSSPERIESVLGLPCGQVSLTLWSMHSVLHIGTSSEQIRVHHTSFSDFLCDQSRSANFFLEERSNLQFLLHKWLHKLMSACHGQLDTLWAAVASVGGSHDAEQQFDRGDCLPGTREQALATIHEWRTSAEPGNPPILWLLGTAGVGKTAMAMNVAKACAANKSLAASFFCFRSDPNRNNPFLLFLSIAHSLTRSIPLLRHVIDEKIMFNPLILESQLEEQFQELVLEPSLELLSTIPKPLPTSPHPNLVVIDGLDQCGDDKEQLRILNTIFSAFQTSPSPPLRFLICSRPEAWIKEALYSERFHLLAKHIVLDNDFHAGEDIKRYLLHEFHEIVTSPEYSHIRFPHPWPSPDVIAWLVETSSRQFIYIVTVMRWIRAKGSHPFKQLDIILKQSPKQPSSAPYRPLDNLYHVILSTHPDPKTLQHVFAAILFLPHISNLPHEFQEGEMVGTPEFIEWVLGLPSGQVSLTLRSMHSILHIGRRDEQIRVHHTSFTDFLRDKARSGDFFLDERPFQHFLLRQWLHNLMATCHQRLDSEDQSLPLPYYVLWKAWFAFAQHVPDTPTEVLSDLEMLDLSALMTTALHGGRWYDLFQLIKGISSWLETRESQSRNTNAAHCLEMAQKHFHIAVPTNHATPTFLKGLFAWMSLELAPVTKQSTWAMMEHALNFRRKDIVISQQSLDKKILVDTNCTCPPSVLHSPREATTPLPNPDPKYAHFHINIPAACALTLDMLTTSLQKVIDSRTTSEALSIVLDVINSQLVSRCPPGHPRVLSVFRRLLSFVTESKEYDIRPYFKTEMRSWLKTFSEEYNEEVNEVWGRYTAIGGKPESVFDKKQGERRTRVSRNV